MIHFTNFRGKNIMKYINRISVLLSFLTVLLFSACNIDQEGPLYTEGEGQGVTFISKSLDGVVVSPAEPTFTIDLLRRIHLQRIVERLLFLLYSIKCHLRDALLPALILLPAKTKRL